MWMNLKKHKEDPMFKSKITVSVMLTGVICSGLFLCVSEYLSGSEAWVAGVCPIIIGIGALIFVLVKRERKGGGEWYVKK